MAMLTSLERQIIQALTRHVSHNDEVSLTELARECHVAKSTVVKAVQKLGYGGFGELAYHARFSAQGRGGLLPHAVVEGDERRAVEELARMLFGCRGKHSVLFSGDRRVGAPLAAYISRKLAMFGIFASPSYDYLMLNDRPEMCGAAVFFFHRELPERREMGQQPGYGEGMLRAARAAGYAVAVFTDDDDKEGQDAADLLVRMATNAEAGVDLYLARVLMMFEMVLVRLSELRASERALSEVE